MDKVTWLKRFWLLLLLCVISGNMYAQVTEIGVSNETELRNAINNVAYEKIYLKNSFSINSMLEISRSVIFDLNNNELKRSGKGSLINYIDIICLKISGGDILIKNGTLIGEHTGVDGYASGLEVRSGSLMLTDVTIKGIVNPKTVGSIRAATGIQYYGGDLSIINGTIAGFGEGKGTSGAKNAIWSDNQSIDNFVKGSYVKKDGNFLNSNDISGETISGSITVFPISYTVDYQLNEGSITTSSYVTSYKFLDILNRTIQPLATVAREYYIFNHWICNDGSTTKNITKSSELPYPYINKEIHTITLTADWTPRTYTIEYNLDGGTSVSNPSSYKIGDNITLNPTSKQGAEFAGWKDTETNTILKDHKLPSDTPKNLMLVAVWDKKYKISFATGTTETITTIETSVSKSTQIPNPNTNKTGCTFGGWSDGQGKVIKESIPAQAYDKDVTLTAIWDEITYNVWFMDGDIPLGDLHKSYTVSKGLSSLPAYGKPGYVFNYWMDKALGNKVESIAVGEIGERTLNANMTAIQYTLEYQYGYNNKTSSVSYTYDKRAAVENPKREGYTFLGWFLSSSYTGNHLVDLPVDGGVSSDGGKKVKFVAYAKWETVKYKVSFDAAGGTPVGNEDYEYDVEAGIPSGKMPTTTRKGYTFAGWFNGNQKIESIPAGMGEMKLVAHWTIIHYTITYNLKGGINPSNVPVSYTCEENVTLPKPTREHYEFAGWVENSTGNGDVVKVIPFGSTENKTYYANWSPMRYTLTFDTNEGAKIPPQSYSYGEGEKFARKTYKTAYTFAGWYYDKALTQFCGESTIPETAGSDYTLYAKWTPTEYKIHYKTYYGSILSGEVETYTYERGVDLPTNVVRSGFTFAGWFADDLLTKPITRIENGNYGEKSVYATWNRGNSVYIVQPKDGKISVKQGDTEIKSGDMVGTGVEVTVSATATTSGYKLKSLNIGGKNYTTSPQKIIVPVGGFSVSAEFHDASPSASAPQILTDPANTDNLFVDSQVKVALKKTDEATTLYYSLDGSTPKLYTGPFVVSASSAKLVSVRGIASKPGYKDGVTTREIGFGVKKITITFDLPVGITATNPQGGEVVSAIASGSFFEFVLQVDASRFESVDSMKVMANDSLIVPNYESVYRLTNQSKDVKIKIKGMKNVKYKVALKQSSNGHIFFTEDESVDPITLEYSKSISVTAVPEMNYKFGGWTDGCQRNPYGLIVVSDTTLEAKFVSDVKYFTMTLPEMEGVTARPLAAYSTEVKQGEKFKFYLRLANGYHAENLVVRANGKVLEVNQEVYSLYDVIQNYSISVEGIVRDKTTAKLAENVSATDLETGADIVKLPLYPESMIAVLATAPAGQEFYKWNDGKRDNPRILTVREAEELVPLFQAKTGTETYVRIQLPTPSGAGMGAVNSDIHSVTVGSDMQLKLVLLPGYNQSDVRVTANGEVLEEGLSLRASSTARTLIYTLFDMKEDLKIEVSGVKRNTYQVSAGSSEGGRVNVSPSGAVEHGKVVSYTATPETGKMFVKWEDGNTLNPYPYTVTGDTRLKAIFMKSDSPVGNDGMTADEALVSVEGYTLRFNLTEASPIYIYAYDGRLVYSDRLPAGISQVPIQAGEWIIRVGDKVPLKRFIR